jgi:hypothetical protein
MDVSTLPKYPPHDEPEPSQGERLRESTTAAVVEWSILVAVFVVGYVLTAWLTLGFVASSAFIM